MAAELMRIRMELARTDGYPEGSHLHGYEFVAPLTGDGHIDAAAWRAKKEKCTVRRFWKGEPETLGALRHVGHGWRFDYDRRETNDDEPFFKLDKHRLVTGAYVSITEHDGVQRPFKVVETMPLHETSAA
jgi:hypothetical protein